MYICTYIAIHIHVYAQLKRWFIPPLQKTYRKNKLYSYQFRPPAINNQRNFAINCKEALNFVII